MSETGPRRDRWDEERPFVAAWLGRRDWDEAFELQERLHAERVAGRVPDVLLLLEHESVYTLGRASDASHLLRPREELVTAGHQVREAGRGGDVTWHGPGQLVAYPIIDLGDGRRDIHRYLRGLEDALIATAGDLGVPARRREGLTGAWTAGGKVGAIGVRVARWVTQHGTALNVSCDLAALAAIVPCGLRGEAVTTIARELENRHDAPGSTTVPPLEDVAGTFARRFASVFRQRGLAERPDALPDGSVVLTGARPAALAIPSTEARRVR